MARIKQATPLRREPSSEYAGKHDLRNWEEGAANGTTTTTTGTDVRGLNGEANGKEKGQVAAAAAAVVRKEAGIVTLVIDVAGIYASL